MRPLEQASVPHSGRNGNFRHADSAFSHKPEVPTQLQCESVTRDGPPSAIITQSSRHWWEDCNGHQQSARITAFTTAFTGGSSSPRLQAEVASDAFNSRTPSLDSFSWLHCANVSAGDASIRISSSASFDINVKKGTGIRRCECQDL
jgi:hypothetical protein